MRSLTVWTAIEAPDPRAAALAGADLEAPSDHGGRQAAGTGPEVAVQAAAPAAVKAVPTFDEVYREHAPFVWRVLHRLGVRPADLEDACQEVFLVVHRKLPGFEQRSSVRTWLYGIAVRCAAEHRRRARRVPESTLAGPELEPTIEEGQSDSVARRQARAVLDDILDDLDDARRSVFVLYELEELSMAEVALALGCPLQTAYSRLHAARAAFEAAVKRRHAREGKR